MQAVLITSANRGLGLEFAAQYLPMAGASTRPAANRDLPKSCSA
jgi:hypothetical protein